MTNEQLNHQAYEDVLDAKSPTMPHNEKYMEYYRGWRNIAGERHFDPYYYEEDYHE